jgi:PAS domain S-box-containing protein
VECMNNPNRVTRLVHKKPDKKGKLHDTEWEFIAIRDENGQITELQGIGQDITDKLNAEKEIAETKSNLEALINNTEDLIWSIDREYRYLYMNQAYKGAVTGHTGSDVPKKGGIALHDAMNNEIMELWKGYYNRGLNGERYTVMTEEKLINSDEIVYYETGFNPIYSAEGIITGVGCFARNITERVRTARTISDKNERLQNIASLSSHELRRPVATMLGLINILDRENYGNPENKQILDHILAVSIELDDVIRLIVDRAFTADQIDSKTRG